MKTIVLRDNMTALERAVANAINGVIANGTADDPQDFFALLESKHENLVEVVPEFFLTEDAHVRWFAEHRDEINRILGAQCAQNDGYYQNEGISQFVKGWDDSDPLALGAGNQTAIVNHVFSSVALYLTTDTDISIP